MSSFQAIILISHGMTVVMSVTVPVHISIHSSALDTKTGKKVAIKKMLKIFHNNTYAKRAVRELRVMKLVDHKNVSF